MFIIKEEIKNILTSISELFLICVLILLSEQCSTGVNLTLCGGLLADAFAFIGLPYSFYYK